MDETGLGPSVLLELQGSSWYNVRYLWMRLDLDHQYSQSCKGQADTMYVIYGWDWALTISTLRAARVKPIQCTLFMDETGLAPSVLSELQGSSWYNIRYLWMRLGLDHQYSQSCKDQADTMYVIYGWDSLDHHQYSQSCKGQADTMYVIYGWDGLDHQYSYSCKGQADTMYIIYGWDWAWTISTLTAARVKLIQCTLFMDEIGLGPSAICTAHISLWATW